MATVPCPFAAYGCSEKKVPSTALQAHLAGAAAEHLNLVCVELVHHRNVARTQQRTLEQEWERELAAFQSATAAREAELKAQVQELQAAVKAQTQTIERLMAGSIIIVDQRGCGMFSSIAAAVKACRSGDTVVVRGGEYTERLVISVPGLTLRGTDTPLTIIRSGAAAPALTLQCNASILGLTLQQDHTGHPCVLITAGAAAMEQCDVTGVETCIAVEADADPSFRQCRIHTSRQIGVCFQPGSRGTLTDCKVFANDAANVQVLAGATITMQGCKLFDARQCGLAIKGAAGLFRDNEIYNSAGDNVQIVDGSPQLLGNSIHSAQQHGVSISGTSQPHLSENQIYNNNGSNIVVSASAQPVIANNEIHHSRQHGILVQPGAGGEIKGNRIHSNIGRAMKLEDGSCAKVQNNNLK